MLVPKIEGVIVMDLIMFFYTLDYFIIKILNLEKLVGKALKYPEFNKNVEDSDDRMTNLKIKVWHFKWK